MTNLDSFLKLRGKEAWDFGKQKLDSGEWTLKHFTNAMTEWCRVNRKQVEQVRWVQEVFEAEL